MLERGYFSCLAGHVYGEDTCFAKLVHRDVAGDRTSIISPCLARPRNRIRLPLLVNDDIGFFHERLNENQKLRGQTCLLTFGVRTLKKFRCLFSSYLDSPSFNHPLLNSFASLVCLVSIGHLVCLVRFVWNIRTLKHEATLSKTPSLTILPLQSLLDEGFSTIDQLLFSPCEDLELLI